MTNTSSKKSRRQFIQKTGIAMLATPLMALAKSEPLVKHLPPMPVDASPRKVYAFSKNLQWLTYKNMADFIAECGFDGVDLTVRKDGHVDPAHVVDDLPKVIEAMKHVGKEVSVITTGILKAEDPHAFATIKTAARMGIQSYRMGWYDYLPAQTIDLNLKIVEVELQKLAAMNKQFKIKGSYQNHAGTNIGAAVWDIGMLLAKVNSPWIGMQYDIRHATVEGANSWINGFNYVKPYIHSLDIKDFVWSKAEGQWSTQNVPLGKGMVDFVAYKKAIAMLPASVPLCLHFEYPLGGAENGDKTISLDAKQVMDFMKKDLEFVKENIL